MSLDIDEYYDILAIALCHAALRYDTTRNIKFSTFAYKVMQRELYMYWRIAYTNQKVIPKEMLISYNSLLKDGLKDTDWVIGNVNKVFNETSAIDYTKTEIEEWIDSLKPTEQFVALRTIMGYTQTEIASQLGVSRSRVNAIIAKLRKKYK